MCLHAPSEARGQFSGVSDLSTLRILRNIQITGAWWEGMLTNGDRFLAPVCLLGARILLCIPRLTEFLALLALSLL